jgi:hypothetical protein
MTINKDDQIRNDTLIFNANQLKKENEEDERGVCRMVLL